MLGNYLQQTTSADDIFRCIFFLGALMVKLLISNFLGLLLSSFLEFLFVCFVALRPKSTVVVMAGQSVHLTTLFPGLEQAVNQYLVHILSFVTENNPS